MSKESERPAVALRREGAKEIVDSKAARRAIGSATAKAFRLHLGAKILG